MSPIEHDGLEESGYTVDRVNTLAAQQYQGLKYTDDKTDARWLAHMLRLGILSTGRIYPPEGRATLFSKRIFREPESQ